MALNFPPQTIGGAKPLDGTTWAAPTGQQWQYDAAIDAWRALGTPSGSGVTYRGPIDLTQDPAAQYANIVAGDFFVVEIGDNPVSNDYPGIAGDEVLEGQEIIFDGTQYAAIGNLVPYATTTIAGKIEIATLAEVTEGTSFELAVTPITLNQYLDGEYQPQLPTGTDGLFLGHEGGSPKWQLLPKGTTQVEGILKLAQRADAPTYEQYFTYYSDTNNTFPANFTDNFSESIALTPYSIAMLVDEIIATQWALIKADENHIGIGGQPILDGKLMTHPVVTDDDEGFMSPAQKQQLEENTTAIEDLQTIDDVDDWTDPPVGTIIFAFGYLDLPWNNGELTPINLGDTIDYSVSPRCLTPSDSDAPRGQVPGLETNPDAIRAGTWRCLGQTIEGREEVILNGDARIIYRIQEATLWQRIS